MSYIDNINLKGTTYRVQDTSAQRILKDMLLSEETVGPSSLVSITGAAPLSAEGLVVDVEPVQAGSGDPSPTNVRPITGWEGVTVKDEGKNLLEVKSFRSALGLSGVVNDDGTISISGTTTQAYNLRAINFDEPYLHLKPGSYKLVENFNKAVPSNVYFYVRKSSNTIWYQAGNQFDIESEDINVWITFLCASDVSLDVVASIMIVPASETATSYEPYKSRTASVSFPETIYGGTVDLTKGKLVVDRAITTLADKTFGTWQSSILPAGGFVPISRFSPSIDVSGIPISDILHGTDYAHRGEEGTIAPNALNSTLYLFTGLQPTEAKAKYGDATIVYHIANPLEYNLTPAELELFKGVNNISADAGKIIVKYWEQKELQTIIKETFQVTGEKLII